MFGPLSAACRCILGTLFRPRIARHFGALSDHILRDIGLTGQPQPQLQPQPVEACKLGAGPKMRFDPYAFPLNVGETS